MGRVIEPRKFSKFVGKPKLKRSVTRKAMGRIREEWTWIPSSHRGLRARHIHKRLLYGSREIST